jgi:hypothetical protein
LGALHPTDSSASRVRLLIGWPSTTWVPQVSVAKPSPSSIAPAMTERAALPVQRVSSLIIDGEDTP